MEWEQEAQTIKPEIAVEILKNNGIVVTIEEAKNILEVVFLLANLSIDQLVTE